MAPIAVTVRFCFSVRVIYERLLWADMGQSNSDANEHRHDENRSGHVLADPKPNLDQEERERRRRDNSAIGIRIAMRDKALIRTFASVQKFSVLR